MAYPLPILKHPIPRPGRPPSRVKSTKISATPISMATTVFNISGKRVELNDTEGQDWTYIGRACNMGGWHLKASKWQNPYQVKKYGRERCLELYEQYVISSKLIEDIEELRGRRLGCFCAPQPCHGDILVRLLHAKTVKKTDTTTSASVN